MTTAHLVNIILCLSSFFLAVLVFEMVDTAIFEFKRHRRESKKMKDEDKQ